MENPKAPPVATPQVAAPQVAAPKVATPAAQKEPPKVEVDESKPIAKVQIRLADGSTLQANFNTSHRVSDLRNFIVRYVI